MVHTVAMRTEASRMSDRDLGVRADYVGNMLEVWRREPAARAFFTAAAQGSLATGASYVAVMLVAYQRLGSAWAASAILLAEMLPGMVAGPLIGAWLDRCDRRRSLVLAEAVR